MKYEWKESNSKGERGMRCYLKDGAVWVSMDLDKVGKLFYASVSIVHMNLLDYALPGIESRVIKMRLDPRKTELGAKRIAGRTARLMIRQEQKLGYI